GTRNGVIRSIDNGVTFGYANNGIPDSAWVYDIAIDSSGILAIASSKGVFISSDNGDNWLTATGIPSEDTTATLSFIDFDSDVINNRLLVGSRGGKIYVNTGIGYAAYALLYFFGPWELAKIFYNASAAVNEVYASTRPRFGFNKLTDSTGVFKSTDNGTSWQQINDGLPQNPPVSALTLREINETSVELYAGLFNDTTNGAGVYKLSVTVDVEQVNGQIPTEYKLEQNYPNPFNPSTTIQFSLPKESFTKLEIFNSLGEKVSTLVSETLSVGTYEYEWKSEGLPSGVYLYRLSTENFMQTKKLLLMK
ncbi:MAG TPA: T9SS type A sorting domain-containing protein, partial [Ignavibacteriaceae bacterium]|nr:T9SS type A sorting domain-containing protein [Ignavibacteriaceae bacterium]